MSNKWERRQKKKGYKGQGEKKNHAHLMSGKGNKRVMNDLYWQKIYQDN